MESQAANKTVRCRYASLCRFYQREGYTCNDEEEACTYCATYDLFENFKPKIAIKA
ncbi:MAG: hypothetical protein QXJ74_05645 [Nitrososphaera sp.]|uniref:hypothetical protein n=1 Tax=Nitrososphaera sp. TaxID=1971748 RepID=UPI0017A1FC31|nr:hypothetical protein [Nitrososphaera sp.]NWG36664.1 hypothetical protein [Nitrososphaera sp.]